MKSISRIFLRKKLNVFVNLEPPYSYKKSLNFELSTCVQKCSAELGPNLQITNFEHIVRPNTSNLYHDLSLFSLFGSCST